MAASSGVRSLSSASPISSGVLGIHTVHIPIEALL